MRYSHPLHPTDTFTSQKLTEYFVVKPSKKKCKIFLDLYSGDKSKTKNNSRVGENIDLVTENIEKMLYLKLIEKGFDDQKESFYKYTKLGRTIALLLLYEEDKQKYRNDLFIQTIDFYGSIHQSYAQFLNIFKEMSTINRF